MNHQLPKGKKTIYKIFNDLNVYLKEKVHWNLCHCGLYHSNRHIPKSYWDYYKKNKQIKNKNGKVGIILRKKDKIFIVQTYNNKYGFPKGSKNEGECKLEGAFREFFEETGFDLKNYVKNNNIPIKRTKFYDKHIYYIINIDENFEITTKPRDDIEITAYGFFHIKDIEKLNYSSILMEYKIKHF